MTAPLSQQDIYDRIYTAISERRLLPGTKLSEERLAHAFGTSRSRIREVLMRLGQELVIELRANRGAFVASPSPRDLREVFDMRRALERAIIVQLATRYGGQAVVALRSHVQNEDRARAAGDRALLARLTGEFHVRLAAITENRMFSDNVRRLSALTSLAIAQYDSLATSACPPHEHADLVEAIESGDARRAEKLMLEHLDHVERGIQQPTHEPAELDFESIFGVAPAPAGAGRRGGRRKPGPAG
ncbi:GntR family transcriptional regulator [Piscinibacter sakaiensis]|uniref:Transcriptional regulator, GntR family n=1 Tax=Piscinibacter sakaiensis TaxID=1547922 RepID=A0A0K8P8Y0_PISS1|nr:GntR family transcriptional regulator [Piscinibacter sakaiensis]GAP38969.1 transcriptional regulator, GntR family [Piscinibacter sakaiensis]